MTASEGTQSPGRVLAAARKTQNISLETIHEKTLIPVWKLKAIENDQYKQLGGRPFALGYIRQVAKLLNVDPEPLVDNFNQICQPAKREDIPDANSTVQTAKNASSPREQKSPLAALWNPWVLVALIGIWVLAVWIFTGDSAEEPQAPEKPPGVSPEPDSALGVDSRATNTEEASPSVTAPVDEGSAGAQQPGVSAVPSASESLLGSELQVQEAPPGSEVPDTQSHNVASMAGMATMTSTTDAAEISDASGETTSEASENNSQDDLAMAFSDQCWVEVRDAHDALLVAKLYDKGDNLRVSGEGPFKVLLGNAVAASVSVNGREVPVVPRATQKTLRMLVSANSPD